MINKSLKDRNKSKIKIEYIVPWTKAEKNKVSEIDLIFSQAVMEHVEDIGFAYSEMYKWLRKGGVISHQIDFKTHEMTKEWNGHWFISERFWRFLLHGRKYPINRFPLSKHLTEIEKAGFDVKTVILVRKQNSFKGKLPKVIGVNFTNDDLAISGAFIQAVKV